MPYIERSDGEIIAAYKEALLRGQSDTDPDKVAFMVDDDIYTVSEILMGLRYKESIVYELFIDNLKQFCLDAGIDPLDVIRKS